MSRLFAVLLLSSVVGSALMGRETYSDHGPTTSLEGTSQPAVGRFSAPIIHGKDVPDASAHQRRGDEQASIDIGNNWYIPVSIGTPPQSFLFLGDSGSPSLTVGSTLLPKKQQLNSPKYNPNNSSTAKKIDGYTYNLCFGSGYCSGGVVYQDAFNVGDLTVSDMHIEVQTHNTGSGAGPRSGTLGLNFDQRGQTTKPEKAPSWLQRIIPYLQSGLFTVDFHPDTSNGTFDFGYIDNSKYMGNIGYAKVNETLGNGEWTIKIARQLLANGTAASTDGWWVTVDTGTPGSGIPRDVADEYFAQTEGAAFNDKRGTFTFPCSSQLVDFTFGIDSFNGTIPADSLKGASIDGGKTCVSKINVTNGTNTSLWGQSFIEQLFVVFDWSNGRVGFANRDLTGSKPSSSASPTKGSNTASATPSISSGSDDEDNGSDAASRVVPSQTLALLSTLILVHALS